MTQKFAELIQTLDKIGKTCVVHLTPKKVEFILAVLGGRNDLITPPFAGKPHSTFDKLRAYSLSSMLFTDKKVLQIA